MKAHAVGSIVESICGKCNDVMGHTIMAMIGNDIVKVECRVCKSVHRYRPHARVTQEGKTLVMKKGREGEPLPSRQVAISQASRPAPVRAAARKTSATVALHESWRAAIRKHEGESARPYTMNETFLAGDFISHPTFGMGEVTAIFPPDKMDVLFENGIKRLLCNKQ